MIKLNDLYTGYSRDKPLLKGFSYEFENKVYGVLGPSGCGKTTLLRTIAGLMKPLSGEVLIDGVKVGKPSKNDVYMMHQNYTSFDWLNCLDNILIAKYIKSKISDEDISRAQEMLKSVMLEGYDERFPKQLSGGQRQRLALARILYMNPGIVLMDEPLSALDSDTREKMQNLVMENHEKNNNTIIIVTHSRDEAKKMCDVVIELK